MHKFSSYHSLLQCDTMELFRSNKSLSMTIITIFNSLQILSINSFMLLRIFHLFFYYHISQIQEFRDIKSSCMSQQ